MPTDPPRRFNPESAAEILARPPEPIDWLWENYIAAGDLFVFAAYMKTGKTTFFYALSSAAAKGIEFLGFPTRKSKVLILALEEHVRDIDRRLRKLQLTPEDKIYIYYPKEPGVPELELIHDYIQEHNIDLVFIDSLAHWWNIRNENDNAEIIAKVVPLHRLARETNAAIGLVHHESKYGGRDAAGQSTGDGRSIRGGGALFGIVDQALLLDRARGGRSNQRMLKAVGRHSESPAELKIELYGSSALSDPRPYGYRNLGTLDELSRATLKNKVFNQLTTEPQETKTIAEQTDVSEKATRQSLEELVAEGKAICTGRGVRGDPFRYQVITTATESEAA